MRTYGMNDVQSPYEHKEYVMGGNVRVRNVETKSNGRRFQEMPPDIAATMRSLIKAREEKH